MRVYITEFKIGEKTYEGPTVVASSFDDAETKAKHYGCDVVGILDVVVTDENEDQWKRVLH
jgi:hypothetical protein|tara:strand:+ start:279 stop:461 length:183 start_codon:yes stop_codon:yes gene_type:complete